jgi:hypothetical protein
MYKVTFHRHYEVSKEEIMKFLNQPSWEAVLYEHDEHDINFAAERIARDWYDDEASEFLDNSEDFVSATVGLISET